MRVFEIANDKGVSEKNLLDILKKGGFKRLNRKSVLNPKAMLFLKKHFNASVNSYIPKVTSVSNVPKNISVKEDLRLFEVAKLMNKDSGDLILALMTKGFLCNRNHVLSKDIVADLGKGFGIEVEFEVIVDMASNITRSSDSKKTRWPILVVMGHVDHGKTTLLDSIRKSNVAAKEAGGITQHIGAYEVDTSHGKLVFLDTPGHSAFSLMRKRGARITDIAILVVAADDGVMPQTIESIKCAKEANVPIVVAINKSDKVGDAAIQTVKRQLAEQDLAPEDWGGNTICVSVSAKTGQGVDELLDMVVLQSEMMELTVDPNLAAKAFIIESNMEKGLGPVASVICIEGTIKKGDYFICGNVRGKVRLIFNSDGEKINQAGPSIPVKIVGFDEIVGSGDILNVVSYQDYLKRKSFTVGQKSSVSAGLEGSKVVNFLVKTDTYGTSEVVVDSVSKVISKLKDKSKDANVIKSAVGNISEGDVVFARDTGAIILGMNIKVEKKASLLARESGVIILQYRVIYHLIEELESLLKREEKAKLVLKKVGDASVIKIFDIKGLGVITGSRVSNGVFSRNGIVICKRNGEEIGRGKVSSLERNKKAVKEVHVDMEFAFMTKDFQEWQLGDTAECFIDVSKK